MRLAPNPLRPHMRPSRRPLVLIALLGSSLLAGLFWHTWPGARATGGGKAPTSDGRGGVSVRAAKHGAPFVNLRDGVGLPNDDAGEGGAGRAQASALASADFDEDGAADLAAGQLVEGGGGLVVVRRGNADAIYPNSAGALGRKARGEFTDAPFMPGVQGFAVPEAADFLGAGDFDADGHWDVVAARRGFSVR